MRKLVFVLMLAVSFALGMVSQNLIAANTKTHPTLIPTTTPPELLLQNIYFYKAPTGLKFEAADPIHGQTTLAVGFKSFQ